MHAPKSILLGLAIAGALALAGVAAAAAPGHDSPGAVYTLTNSPAGNAVAVFDRAADGSLTPDGSYATGGLGTGSNLGSQSAVALADDARQLYAVNAGSDSVSAFAVEPDGLRLENVVPSGGSRPISVAISHDLVYVLNAGGAGSISGFRATHDGLAPIAGSTRPLSAGASGPAQVAFGPTGDTLVVTEKASNTIDTFAIGRDGVAGAATAHASTGATPFGFDVDRQGHVLVSNAAGSASAYALGRDASLTPIGGPVSTAGQAAPCWLVVSKNGRYAYTANAGSGSISGFSVGADGSLALLDANGVTASTGAGSHPLDEAVSGDGRFLYVLTDGLHDVTGFAIGADGSLVQVTQAGALSAGSVGLAAR